MSWLNQVGDRIGNAVGEFARGLLLGPMVSCASQQQLKDPSDFAHASPRPEWINKPKDGYTVAESECLLFASRVSENVAKTTLFSFAISDAIHKQCGSEPQKISLEDESRIVNEEARAALLEKANHFIEQCSIEPDNEGLKIYLEVANSFIECTAPQKTQQK